MRPLLVIGYGNELRGDDAAGPRAAAAVDKLRLIRVRVLLRHQLTPELAEELAAAQAVIFVDATLEPAPGVRVLPLEANLTPPSQPPAITHAASPSGLLALSRELYGRSPSGWIVSIPGQNFDFSELLSPLAETGVKLAVEQIRKLLGV
jgi:hydrogenase maturation protease